MKKWYKREILGVLILVLMSIMIAGSIPAQTKLPASKGISSLKGLPAINIPASFASDDVVGYFRVKNLASFLGVIDSWVSRVNPQMPPGTAKMMVGQYMGDPTLAAIDSSKPLLVLILNPKKFPNPLVLYLPVTDPNKIQQGIQAKGSFTVVKEKTVIAGDDQPSVMKGVELWSMVQPFSILPMDSDLLASTDVEKLMALYGADIRQKIKDFQSQLSMMQAAQTGQQNQQSLAAQQKQIEAQVEEMFKMLNEIKTFSIEANAWPQGLQTTVLARAKPQTDMAKLFTVKSVSPPTLVKLLPEGAFKLSFAGDPESVSEFGGKMTDRFMQKSGALTPEQMQIVKKYQDAQKEAMGGEVAMSIFLPELQGVNGVVMYKVKDEKKALELVRLSPEQAKLASNPAQGLTVTANLTEKARKVEGVDVHTLRVNFTSTNPMAMQAMMMFFPTGGMNIESAILNKTLIYSIGTPVDQSIKAVKSGSGNTTLKAFSTFPSGGQLNGDLDLISAIKTILSPMFAMMAQMMGPGQPNPLDALNKISAPPITFFATMHDGNMMGKANFDIDIVLKIKEAFSTMKGQMTPGQQQKMGP